MSIEKLIEENTATAKELIAAMNTLSAAIMNGEFNTGGEVTKEDVARVEAGDKKAAAKETKKSTAATASPAKDAGQPASEKQDSAKEKAAPTEAETQALYDSIKQPFLALVAKDRAKAQSIVDTINVKALKKANYEQLLKAKELLGLGEPEEELG